MFNTELVVSRKEAKNWMEQRAEQWGGGPAPQHPLRHTDMFSCRDSGDLFVNSKHEDCLPNDHRSFTKDEVPGESETEIPFVKNPRFFSTNTSPPWVYIILISSIWLKATKAKICNGNNHHRKQADVYFFKELCVCLHPKNTLTAKEHLNPLDFESFHWTD